MGRPELRRRAGRAGRAAGAEAGRAAPPGRGLGGLGRSVEWDGLCWAWLTAGRVASGDLIGVGPALPLTPGASGLKPQARRGAPQVREVWWGAEGGWGPPTALYIGGVGVGAGAGGLQEEVRGGERRAFLAEGLRPPASQAPGGGSACGDWCHVQEVRVQSQRLFLRALQPQGVGENSLTMTTAAWGACPLCQAPHSPLCA